jgi:hypothetical protein
LQHYLWPSVAQAEVTGYGSFDDQVEGRKNLQVTMFDPDTKLEDLTFVTYLSESDLKKNKVYQ